MAFSVYEIRGDEEFLLFETNEIKAAGEWMVANHHRFPSWRVEVFCKR